jgi:integrase
MPNVREKNGILFFDFRYRGERCREYTKLDDTPANRKRMQKVLDKIEQEMLAGTFSYAAYFPESKLLAKFGEGVATSPARSASQGRGSSTPLFRDFIEVWYAECLPGWRRSHAATLRSTIDRHLVPFFGDRPVGEIQKAEVLAFRAELAKLKGRSGNTTMSPKSVNRVMQILSQALAEAAERYAFANPADRIKRLKPRRVDIHPLSLAEVRKIIETVRPDFQPYMTVRFFTGMRTGEIHGLKWRFVDFERRQILVRETLVRGQVEYTKTDGSQREIAMSAPVLEALRAQQARTGGAEYVFCTASGAPLDNDNYMHRVWYPLLRHLGLEKRRPYQTRHTCATLWLGSGENPEWVARQLGHVNTLMLFRTYSRFIPNLTRQDGSAFDSLVSSVIQSAVPANDLRAVSAQTEESRHG